MPSLARTLLQDVFNLFYPNICVACGDSLIADEEVVCSGCEIEVPRANFWHQPENILAQRFWGRVPLSGASALYVFKKHDAVQQLIHQLKYKGRKDVGVFIGKKIGTELLDSRSVIQNVDLILPVPLHWKKQKTRGYNQCDFIAQGISEAAKIPYSNSVLERTEEKVSQTKKKRFDRFGNVSEIFRVVKPEEIKGKHVLLVDDVVTTGATAEACLQTILKSGAEKISFVAAAMAGR
jgi:ComF family protein